MAQVNRPPNYVPPLSADAHRALDELIALEQTHLYNIQQAELCGLPLPQYKSRSEQRLALANLLKQHFPPPE